MNSLKESSAEVVAKSVEKISDSKGLEAIGSALGVFGTAFAIFFCVGLPMTALILGNKWDGRLFEQKECFKIQEIRGEVYKLNTCTGELMPLELPEKGNDLTVKP